MTRLTCEMCGSSDFVKQDGLFVCQSCKCKYTPEEAKKILVVNPIKIDQSEKLKNLFDLARRAKDEGNSEKAIEYYDHILEEEPRNWEAAFFSVYFHALSCRVYEIPSETQKLINSVNNVADLIESIESNDEKKTAYLEIAIRILAFSKAVYDHAYSIYLPIRTNIHNGVTDNYMPPEVLNAQEDFTNRVSPLVSLDVAWAEKLDQICLDRYQDDLEFRQKIVKLWKDAVSITHTIYNWENKRQQAVTEESINRIVDPYIEKIKRYEPNYVDPKTKLKKAQTAMQESQKGCYVATAVYESYDCPQVWTLRRYRDFKLARSVFGRAFIRIYYAISPTVIKWFGSTKWFKRFMKTKLDAFVTKLIQEGFSDTPYTDQKW